MDLLTNMKTIFISPISRVTNDPSEWFAVREDWFSWVPLSSTYTDDGELVGHYRAGDHLEILTPAAAKFAREADEDEREWEVGDVILAYEDYDLFSSCKGEDGFDLQTTYKVLAYTYWDGHNWKSLIIADQIANEETHEIADDDTARRLQARRNFARLKSERAGVHEYTHGILKSNYEGEFALYSIQL